MLNPGATQGLRSQLRGELIEPEHAGYDAARKVYNAMIDRYPRLIARCADVADVIACVRFAARARCRSSRSAAAATTAAAWAVCDNGLVIDLSRLRGIRVDPAAKHGPGGGGLHMGRRGSRHARVWPGRRRAASSPPPAWAA